MAEDKFYIRDNRIEWVYYNPDSSAGGQYVYNMINPSQIQDAAGLNTSEFFDVIGGECVQFLVDVDAFGFNEADYHFQTVPGDFEECTAETQAALIRYAQQQLLGDETAEAEPYDGKLDKRVKQKLDGEYNSFMDNVMKLPVDNILRNIEEIAAMMDVYNYVTEYGELDEKEVNWFLSADRPLSALRDQWLYNDKDLSDSLNQALWNLCDPPELAEDEGDYEQGDD